MVVGFNPDSLGHAGSAGDLFAADFKADPYWLDDCPAPASPDISPPERADVVVIGSGYTGLNAALQTARAGRSTIVLEAGAPGMGCSTKNGAHISTSIKPGLAALTRQYGAERGAAIRGEGRSALDWIETLVRNEQIECDFRRCGRFHGAHSPAAYEKAAREAERNQRLEGVEAHIVPQADQHRDIGTGFYHGGVVFPRYAALHPGRYHRGLMQRVCDAGASIAAHCPATAIERDIKGFQVRTPKGSVQARDVIVATNGYTSDLTPWLKRRVIPIGSYVIATEPLAPGIMDQILPTRRLVTDTRKVVYYYGPSPDGTRLIFGGRVSTGETDPRISGPRLHADMVRIFPQLAGTRISHSWMGFVAYTFDEMPHCGTHDGLHYCMGYCGAGVSLSSYLGMRTGQRVLGLAEGRTAFDGLGFPTRPLYAGKPWFLPAAVALYRWRDRIETRWAARDNPIQTRAP